MTTARTGVVGSPVTLLLGAMACAAIGAGGALWVGSSDPVPAPGQSAAGVTVELDAIARRIDALESAPASVAAGSTPQRHDREDAGMAAAVAALVERVAQLERAVSTMQSRASQPGGGAPPGNKDATVEPDPAEIALQIQSCQHAILDQGTSEEAKLAAWRQLRRARDAYTDAVVAQMVHVGLTSPDPDVRADVWRQADGNSRHDALVPAMLQALQTDAVEDVREEAAETLVGYASRPGVEATLGHLLATEQNEDVRRYLEAALRRAAKNR